jgi:hypothetical protein
MDVYETGVDRYTFGCGTNGGNKVWLFRLLSVNKAPPDYTVSPS